MVHTQDGSSEKEFFEKLESAKRSLCSNEQKTCHLQASVQTLKNTLHVHEETCHNSLDILKHLSKETVDEQEQFQLKNYDLTWKTDLIQCITAVESLVRIKKYLLVVQQVQSLSSKIETSLKGNNNQSALHYTLKLADQVNELSSSNCRHLLGYCSDSLLHWHKEIKKEVSKTLMMTLKDLSWPVVAVINEGLNTQMKKDKPQDLKQDIDLVKLLCELESKMELCGISVPSFILENLMAPFKERFFYHFYGDKATNSIDKPEWFLSQTVRWMHDHVSVIEKVLSRFLPSNDQSKVKISEVQDKFVMQLVDMCAAKIETSLELIIPSDGLQTDNNLLAHWIDEVISFESEIQSTYCTPNSKLPCLKIFTKKQYLPDWLVLEKHHLDEDICVFLDSSNAWEIRETEEPSNPNFKVPLCVNNFITDLLLMSERSGKIGDDKIQCHFDQVQADALHRFVDRMQEICCEREDKKMAIVNGLNYIRTVVEDWVELKMLSSAAVDDNLYDSREMTPCSSAWNDLTKKLDNQINTYLRELAVKSELEIIEVLKTYRTANWHNFESPKEFVVRVLSTPGCHLIITLRQHLNTFHSYLSSSLFKHVFKDIICKLDADFTEQFVMQSKFNEGGAYQFRFDLEENLLLLFTLWDIPVDKGKRFMQRTHECNVLLNFLPGTGALVRDMLSTCYQPGHKRGDCCKRLDTVLSDNNIVALTYPQVRTVLQCRIDWPQI